MGKPLYFLLWRLRPVDRSWLRKGQWQLETVTARVSSALLVEECTGPGLPGAGNVRPRPVAPEHSRCEAGVTGKWEEPRRGRGGGGGDLGLRAQSLWGFTHL